MAAGSRPSARRFKPQPPKVHLHILGICGTLMAGIATLAQELGHRVTGADANVYPPMSDTLRAAGIALTEGWGPLARQEHPDLVVIGNALSRGNPSVEYVLDHDLPYTSGPAWLAAHVLPGRHVIAIAGTHGKTTTASIVAWLLECADHQPGFLIGGIPLNFGVPARLGRSPFFVVEADEYDTAFFDKRSKFVHYRPRTAVLNNLEFDHADIFPDLAAIKLQFHHLVRTIPASGNIIWNVDDANLAATLEQGCWSRTATFGSSTSAAWRLQPNAHTEEPVLEIRLPDGQQRRLTTTLSGRHNALNTTAAIAAVALAGGAPPDLQSAIQSFAGVKRRLEEIGRVRGIVVYDDFAHHPTAIAATLAGLRARIGADQLIAVLEPRSNTMRLGVHRTDLAPALAGADLSIIYAPPNLGWDTQPVVAALGARGASYDSLDAVLAAIERAAQSPAHIVIMSNGGFGGLHQRLLASLSASV